VLVLNDPASGPADPAASYAEFASGMPAAPRLDLANSTVMDAFAVTGVSDVTRDATYLMIPTKSASSVGPGRYSTRHIIAHRQAFRTLVP